MKLHSLIKLPSRKPIKRLGRGEGSGWGKTAGRGSNGQKARSGDSIPPTFSGGNISFTRRMPKLGGFRNINRIEYAAVNLSVLNAFEANTVVTPEMLREKGILRANETRIKILGGGELNKSVSVQAHKISKPALEAIKKAGGEFVQL
jgi:large subunit ribosomal protein L15